MSGLRTKNIVFVILLTFCFQQNTLVFCADNDGIQLSTNLLPKKSQKEDEPTSWQKIQQFVSRYKGRIITGSVATALVIVAVKNWRAQQNLPAQPQPERQPDLGGGQQPPIVPQQPPANRVQSAQSVVSQSLQQTTLVPRAEDQQIDQGFWKRIRHTIATVHVPDYRRTHSINIRNTTIEIVQLPVYFQSSETIKNMVRHEGSFCAGHTILLAREMTSHESYDELERLLANEQFLTKRIQEVVDAIKRMRISNLKSLDNKKIDVWLSEANGNNYFNWVGQAVVDYVRSHRTEIEQASSTVEWIMRKEAGKTHETRLYELCYPCWLVESEINQLIDTSRILVISIPRNSSIFEPLSSTCGKTSQAIRKRLDNVSNEDVSQLKKDVKLDIMNNLTNFIGRIVQQRKNGTSQVIISNRQGKDHWFPIKLSPAKGNSSYNIAIMDMGGETQTKTADVAALAHIFVAELPDSIIDAFASLIVDIDIIASSPLPKKSDAIKTALQNIVDNVVHQKEQKNLENPFFTLYRLSPLFDMIRIMAPIVGINSFPVIYKNVNFGTVTIASTMKLSNFVDEVIRLLN